MITKTEQNPLADDIFKTVVVLMAIGTVFVSSASANLSQNIDLQRLFNLRQLRQLLFFPIAVLIIYLFSLLDYRKLNLSAGLKKSPVTFLLLLSIALLILVLIPAIGTEINRARRWFRFAIGPVNISFQPSELAKWSLVFFLAAIADKYSSHIKLYLKGFLPTCAVITVVVGLIIIEDFGTAALISLLSLLMLIIAGARTWHILTLLPPAATALVAAIAFYPHRIQRIAAFVNPAKWAGSVAYQANQSLIALGSGGLWGKGLGRGISKYGHLPEDTTDFIFAIIGEELGLVGTCSVILLFVIFIWLGIAVIKRCNDRFGRLLAAGIVLTIAIGAVLNIGVVTVVLPTKGLPLPFVSAGGTSMLLCAAAVGILLNIVGQSSIEQAGEPVL